MHQGLSPHWKHSHRMQIELFPLFIHWGCSHSVDLDVRIGHEKWRLDSRFLDEHRGVVAEKANACMMRTCWPTRIKNFSGCSFPEFDGPEMRSCEVVNASNVQRRSPFRAPKSFNKATSSESAAREHVYLFFQRLETAEKVQASYGLQSRTDRDFNCWKIILENSQPMKLCSCAVNKNNLAFSISKWASINDHAEKDATNVVFDFVSAALVVECHTRSC